MAKKKILMIVGIVFMILVIGFIWRIKRGESPAIVSEVEKEQTITPENKIYKLMMLEFNRDLTKLDISEMNEDERDFYYLYLYNYSD